MNTIPILNYHNIGNPPAGVHLPSMYVSENAFAWQMRILHYLGFQGLSMSAAMPYLLGEKAGRVAVITFDDGYLDTVQIALPVLRSHNFSATCYLVSQCIGQYNKWDAVTLKIRKPLASRDQLAEWAAAGMEVGAHTRTHPHLTSCQDATLWDEIAGCKKDLEDTLGIAVEHFCYPYGDWDSRVADTVRQAGFHTATTTRRGRVKPNDELFWLRRVSINGRNGLHLFPLKLLTSYEDRRG